MAKIIPIVIMTAVAKGKIWFMFLLNVTLIA